MKRAFVLAGGLALIAGAWACDSLSNPDKDKDANTTVKTTAKVKGALVGTVPANTHVAVVWRTTQGLTRADDAPVVNGQFTLDLGAPPTGALASEDVYNTPVVTQDASVPNPTAVADASVGDDASVGFKSLRPQAGLNGTTGSNLLVGYAGFIVYVDTNLNGQLDFAAPDLASDQIIGGDKDITLVYLKDGSNFDLEKRRDNIGTLPGNGYNLSVNDGRGARWFPFEVQLKLYRTGLPYEVCANTYSIVVPTDAGTSVRCVDNGVQYDREVCTTQGPSPNSMCADTSISYAPTGCTTEFGGRLDAGTNEFGGATHYPPPADWPCQLDYDAGPPPVETWFDAGPFDDAG